MVHNFVEVYWCACQFYSQYPLPTGRDCFVVKILPGWKTGLMCTLWFWGRKALVNILAEVSMISLTRRLRRQLAAAGPETFAQLWQAVLTSETRHTWEPLCCSEFCTALQEFRCNCLSRCTCWSCCDLHKRSHVDSWFDWHNLRPSSLNVQGTLNDRCEHLMKRMRFYY